jgi:hypothetical protein
LEILSGWCFSLAQTFISTMLAAAMSVEGVFLKCEFLVVMFATVIASGTALYLSMVDLPDFFDDLSLLAWCDVLFLCSVVFPLYLSYKNTGARAAPGYESLEALLLDPEGYNAFYLFLKNEFSTENLLFYSTVKKFQEQVDQGNHRNLKSLQDQAYRIYKNFLVPNSTYEVNVPHAARLAVAENILKKFRRFSAIEESKRSEHSSNLGPLDKNPDAQTPSLRASQAGTDSKSQTPQIGPLALNSPKTGGPRQPFSLDGSPSKHLAPALGQSTEESPRLAGDVLEDKYSPKLDSLTITIDTLNPRPLTPVGGHKKKHTRTSSCPSALNTESFDTIVTRPRDGSLHHNIESPRAAKEVNVDEVAAVRSIFDVPQQYVYHLMRTDSFGRFVLSNSYKELLSSKAPSLWKAPRKSVRPSISEEIRNFAEFKDDVTIKSLMDKKQDLRMKKPDWKPRINLGRTTGHVRTTKQSHTVELYSSSSMSPPTETRDLDSSNSPPQTQIQITTDFDHSGSRKVKSDSQEMLILPGLDTLPVLREGGTPRDSKDKELEDRSVVDQDIKRTIASAASSTIVGAFGGSSLPTLPNLNLTTILGRDRTQRTEIPTKPKPQRKLGTSFFAPLQTNRRGSM